MSAPLVELYEVSKSYPQVDRRHHRLSALYHALRGRRSPGTHHAVVENISLRVQAGQSLAIVGENGAGKSTLLKLIAGVLHPSSGHITVNCRIGALLELGAGFNPQLSGRDNIDAAAALMGLAEFDRYQLLAQVLDFSELEDVIDEPIKHYSTGMVVRLGFALIAALRPQLLITDEVLAVGDEAFQKKCIGWLQSYLQDGGTLLLVSHSLYHVQKLCHSAIWIDQGRIREQGDVYQVSRSYLAFHETKLGAGVDQAATHRCEVTALQTHLDQDANLIRANAQLSQPAVLALSLLRSDGSTVACAVTSEQAATHTLSLPSNQLLPGLYQIQAVPVNAARKRLGSAVKQLLEIKGTSREFGNLRLAHEWL